MGNRCANINTQEFKDLVVEAAKINKSEAKVIANTHAWQTNNQTDAIPTVDELYGDQDTGLPKDEKFAKIVKQDLTTMEKVRENLLGSIGLQLKTLKGKTEGNKTLTEFQDTLKEIQEKLSDYDKLEHSTAVLNYLQTTGVLMSKIENQIKIFKSKNTDLSNTSLNNIKLDINLIGFFKSTLNNYALIPDIQEELSNSTLSQDPVLKEYENKDELIEYVDELTSRLDKAHRNIKTIAKPRLAGYLAPYDTRVANQIKEKLTKEIKSKVGKNPGEVSKDYLERINKLVQAEMPSEKELSKKGFDYFMGKLNNVNVDISTFSAWVNSELDINNQVVQVLSKILDEADMFTQTNMLEVKLETFDILKTNKDLVNSANPKKAYEGFYQEGSDGNLYITTEYSIEFIIERNKLIANIEAAKDKFGEGSAQQDKAIEDLSKWNKENIINKIPTSKWKNPNYDSVKDKAVYKNIIKLATNSDVNLNGNQSLFIQYNDITFLQTPNNSRQGFETLTSGNLADQAKDALERMYSKDKADIEEFGQQLPKEAKARKKAVDKLIREKLAKGESVDELQDELNYLSVLTNSVGDIKNQVPIFYRGQQDLKTQSYDLTSIFMMDYYMSENYAQKTKVKDAAELLLSLVNESKFTQTQGLTKKILVQALGKNTFKEVEQMMGDQSNVGKVLKSVLENRLYGIKTVATEGAQLANTLMGWSSMTMLGLNYLAGSANILQGKVMNFIEGVAGEFFTVKDLKAGESSFWADMPNWMSDIGKPVQISKSHILMDYFNIQGEFKPFTSRMNEDNRFKYLFNKSHLFALNNMGEFYIHGTLMYSILNNIKVKNKNNEYIDFNGAVVSKDKAMTLSEALTVDKTGKPQLNENVKYTSYGNKSFSLNLDKDKGLHEVRLLINKIAHDLHGNYNNEIQAMAQRHVIGKMVFMLRKWIVPGFNKRFRGMATANRPVEALTEDQRFYSEYNQTFQEGHYTTFIRFLNNARKEYKSLGMRVFSQKINEMSSTELANMKRTGAELGFIALSFLASVAAKALAGNLDDEDEKALLYAAFYSRRLYTEMSFFIDPGSTFQIIGSPAAGVSYFQDIYAVLTQMTSDGARLISGEDIERYERTRRKGMSKLWKRTTDVMPILNVSDRTVQESTSYLYNL